MKRLAAVLSVLFGMVAVLGVAPTASAAPFCGIRWGSLAKEASTTAFPGHLVDVRAGRHACYDRLVLDVADAGISHYYVSYVDQVREDGSGHVVPLRGGARLAIVAGVPAYDDEGNLTYRPANRRQLVNVSGWQTFRQVAYAGTFEGRPPSGSGCGHGCRSGCSS
jgi:hypothetical protein